MRLQLFMLTVSTGAFLCIANGGEQETDNSVDTTTFDLPDEYLDSIIRRLGQCLYNYIDYEGRKAAIGCKATCRQTEPSLQARDDSDGSEENTLKLSEKLCVLVTGNMTCDNGTVLLQGYLGNCTDGICIANQTGPLITILGREETESLAGTGEVDEQESK
uniref:Putative conserved secreted protein n=1 Tax=Ixodes ricinus TaxID=34613 RepID=A0A6B0UWX5_IXORI